MRTKNAGVGMWNEEVSMKNLKPITPPLLRKFGLSEDNIKMVNTLEELEKNPPNIIIAEAKNSFKFIQNFYKEQWLKKRVKYVMGLGVYQQLEKRGKKKLLVPSSIKFKNVYRPYKGQELHDKTILVFRTGGIGDLLFIQPNLTYLKEKYPTCTIKFACGPQYQPMVKTWDIVDEVVDLPFSFATLQSADYHVLFEGVIERCKQAHTDNAYNLFSHWMGLDLPDELLLPKQTVREDLLEYCQEKLDNWGVDKFILMQLRASSAIRTPRHTFWLQIINELNKRGYKIVLTDNPRQAENIDDFIKLCEKPDMVFNFCKHSKSIAHSIALVKLATCVLATDSAMNHIAASLDTKSFGIYGPFPGHIRLKTYPKAAWVDADRHCVPCFLHGHEGCPYSGADAYSPCYDELINTKEKLESLINGIEEHING
jgi:ADP-heptose:LPS heptosyltransferase